MSRESFPGQGSYWAVEASGRWGLSRALVVGAVADRAGVAGIVEFAEVVDIVVVGWDRELVVGSLEIVRRCRALVEGLGSPRLGRAGTAPFDFVSAVAPDFAFVVLFVAVFAVVFVGIARGFRRPVGFLPFPQVVH